jgi:uncharacterized protein (TIGR00730 family)
MRKNSGEGGEEPQRIAHTQRQRKAARSRALVRNICVYCGSNIGTKPVYAAAARQLGTAIAAEGIGLVYGGGGLGLMGELARAAIAGGGRVTGIIPAFLSEKERMLREADELVVVEDMHQRKKLMFDRADAFVALPGGIGTLEELVEQLTWAQLGRHTKPIVLVNIDGFWGPLLQLLRHMHEAAFIRPDMDVPFVTVNSADQVIATILAAARAQHEEISTAVREKF